MEQMYQYLWKHRMLGKSLTLEDGEELEVLSPGMLNTDAGPDFSNARLLIDGTEWIGNVEIHVRASDWLRHGHDKDKAYDSVALHVVAVSDTRIRRADGRLIPQFTVVFPESFFEMYARLSEGIAAVRCENDIKDVPRLIAEDWLESLAVERMQVKARRVLEESRNCGGDWEKVCFITLARALGFGLNGEPFEMLARSLPLGYLHRHSDNLFQIEALLFGQAGMLDSSVHIFDDYYQTLCREYYFLARKYGLRPMRADLWKYARTRPQNFPHRRIAVLAKMVYGGFSLMSRLLEAHGDVDKIREMLKVRLEGYWSTHTDFDREGSSGGDVLGQASIDLLLINFAAPLVYAHGVSRGDGDAAETGMMIWESLSPEKNQFVRYWNGLGLAAVSASRSQALLQLRKEYCDASRCLECRIGHWLLRSEAGGLKNIKERLSK